MKKTPEEIEKLAESCYGTEIGSIRGSNQYDLEADRKNGFIKGYTQCQQDNAERERKVAIGFYKWVDENYLYIGNSLYRFNIHDSDTYYKIEQLYDIFLTTLNKQ